ncbi:MAG: hypothetical protein L0H53_13845 [Candidatus Nitrosocosmicus sp.]|nr:hypothetical protein [Candidatus Nitrosocosmicus sp.]MDN5868790.1 hypothetical protein [Candidatus Nitrosocosmicus sp.]
MQNNRPLGVTIIAILAILGGIGSLVGGIVLVAIIPFLGAALIIIGLAYFGVAYGLWQGLKWAWIITLIVTVVAFISGLGSIIVGNVGAVIPVIINAIIIYYLFRPNVKAYFGK